MSKLRLPVRVFVVAVIAAATIALGGVALLAPVVATDALLVAALLAVATVAQLQVVHLSAKTKVSVGDAAIFASVLMLPAPLAMLVGGASTFIGLRFATRQPLYNRLFNASGTVLAAGASSVLHGALSRGGALLDDPISLLVSAIAYYLVKVTVTDVVVALQLRRIPFRTWWSDHRREIWHHTALYLLGILAAVSAERQTWSLALFLAPMGLILLALREATRLRQHTKDAIVQLADLIDQRDPYTYGHSQRVAELSRRVARQLKLPTERVDLVTEAARMHDIGKISTPDQILKKPGPLSEREWVEMRKHCEGGHSFLQQLPDFAEGADLVLSHHERFDGKGYPRGLKGVDLPLEASIIAVCDAYDAMTSDRVYRPALPPHRVIEELRAGRGTQWHARAIDGMLALVEQGALAEIMAPAAATAG